MDFTDETILITGANTGLGLVSAVHCLQKGAARVIITSRDAKKGAAAVSQVKHLSGDVKGTVEVWPLDLLHRKSIEALAERASHLPRLDRVLLNAGLATMNFKTVNGIEEMTAVGVYGTFLLLALLMPTLRGSGRVTGRKSTVTVVSSDLHRNAKFVERREEMVLARLNEKREARMLDRYVIWGVRGLGVYGI